MRGPICPLPGCFSARQRHCQAFPDSNDYKTTYFSFSQRGGAPLLRKVETRLGGPPALYVPLDVPYSLYDIYKGKRKVGYVHGVNQKGQFGVLEVFVSLDTKRSGEIGDILQHLNKHSGLTIVMVTHNPGLGRLGGRAIEMRDGKAYEH
jgi:hypothetical protein